MGMWSYFNIQKQNLMTDFRAIPYFTKLCYKATLHHTHKKSYLTIIEIKFATVTGKIQKLTLFSQSRTISNNNSPYIPVR